MAAVVDATPGTELVCLWATILARFEWRRLNRALLQTATFTEFFRNTRRRIDGTPLPPDISLLDHGEPGQVFIVYADADPKGGSCGGLVFIDEITERYLANASQSKRQRERRILEVGLALRPRNGRATVAWKEDPSRALSIEIASLLLSDQEIENLYDVTGRLPAISILTNTTFKGGAAIEGQHLTAILPGRWLGTATVAGNA